MSEGDIMSENKPSGEAIKTQIDDLRQEWDRLDDQGSQSATQTQISKQIEQLQKQLKELTGEDY
jgi:flagellar hook-associated protein FlgK